MAYCSYCGAYIADGSHFCSSCGAPVTQTTVQTTVAPTPAIAAGTLTAQVYSGEGYAVMLVDSGSCAAATAADLISDTCGYSDAEAMLLVSNAPTLIAQGLTQQQAVYLAQSLTEYGMAAAIYDKHGNKTFASDVDSVFDMSGSYLTKVAATLGLIGIGNRITNSIRRLTLASRPPVYTLNRPAPRKPPVRRQALGRPAPQPPRKPEPPRPAPMPAQPAPRKAAAKPAPTPQRAAPKPVAPAPQKATPKHQPKQPGNQPQRADHRGPQAGPRAQGPGNGPGRRG